MHPPTYSLTVGPTPGGPYRQLYLSFSRKPERRIRGTAFRVGGSRACTQMVQFCVSRLSWLEIASEAIACSRSPPAASSAKRYPAAAATGRWYDRAPGWGMTGSVAVTLAPTHRWRSPSCRVSLALLGDGCLVGAGGGEDELGDGIHRYRGGVDHQVV